MDEVCEQMKADDIRKSPEYLLRRKALLGTDKPKVKKVPVWLTAILSRMKFK